MENYSQNTRNALIEYEILLREGHLKRMSNNYFQQTDEENEKTAVAIFKYAFEKILHWDPVDVINCLSRNVLAQMSLTIPYAKLRYPRELSKKSDFFYVAKICYPDKVHSFSEHDLIIYKYKSILNDKNAKFPKEYFVGAEGVERAAVCLQYTLSNRHVFNSPEELYELFSDPVAGREFLKKYRLTNALNLLYDGCPLEYLHESLALEQRDELLYNYGKFIREYENSDAKRIEPEGIREFCDGKVSKKG